MSDVCHVCGPVKHEAPTVLCAACALITTARGQRAVRRRKSIDRMYREVKARDHDAYRIAVESADSIAINHQLPSNVAADIEAALMSLAHRSLP